MPLHWIPQAPLLKLLRQSAIVLVLGTTILTGSVATGGQTSSKSPSRAELGSGTAGTRPKLPARVVALGDSVTSGSNCGCDPFPQLYGKDLLRLRGWPTSVDNLGSGGMDSAGLLRELDDPESGFDPGVAHADIVLVTIGANDFAADHDAVTQGDCAADGATECVSDELSQMKDNVSAILARINELRQNKRTAVLVTGYWNVFEGGDVARSLYPPAGVRATQTLTSRVNDTLRMVAIQAGDTYVDLFAPFHSTASDGNVTTLLAPDGDHPNAAGHALIADRLIAAGLPGLLPN